MANERDLKESRVDGGSAPAEESENVANESNLKEGMSMAPMKPLSMK